MNTQREQYLLLKELDDVVPHLKASHAILAGGAITSLFTGQRVKDWDLYFRTQEDFAIAQAAFIENGTLTFSSDLSFTYKWGARKKPFQLIHDPAISGSPENIFARFDFTICMGAYDFLWETFVFHPDFFKHLSQRRLYFSPATLFPICSLLRVLKYQSKGYAISGVEVLKIGLAIQHLEIKTYADLRRQIMGIDTYFLRELTDQFKEGELAEQTYELERFLEMVNEYIVKHAEHLSTEEAGEE